MASRTMSQPAARTQREEAKADGPPRVLLIDDNPSDRALAARELARELPGSEILQITGEGPFQRVLQGFDFAVAVTDYQLRWTDGLAILRAIKARCPDCPVVMFTGTGTEEVVVEAMKAGLDDYIIKKPRHFARLSLSVKKALQRAAERKALRSVETRYLGLFEGVPVGLCRVSPSGEILDANPALVQMLGYPNRETLIGVDGASFHAHPEAKSSLLAALRQDGVVRDFETQLRRRDGGGIRVRLNARAFHDERGNLEFIEGVLEDVSERGRIEAELRNRAGQHAALAELGQRALSGEELSSLMDDVVVLVASTLNVELCKVLELLPDQRTLLLRAGVGFREGLVARATIPIDSDSPPGYTLLMKEPVIMDDLGCEGGFRAPALLEEHGAVSGVRVIIPGGEKPYGLLGVYSTRRRQFSRDDTHFLQSVANLLAAAIQRQETQQALHEAEAKFLQAQKMEAIGRLAGGVAHDFNNLLTAITGFAELGLAHVGKEDPLRRDLDEIRKAGERAARLTRQLLAFSRRQVMQPRVLDLGNLVADLSKMLRRVIGEDIELVALTEPELGRVHADPGQLEQVIMNLAVNSRDAMPQGGKLIIEASNVELTDAYARNHPAVKPGHYVVLAVSDTGCGMDRETQAHIFEPFFTTKGPRGGTGLGLATVYGIVKQSDGNIWVYSEPGRGTSFKIYLPRVDRPADALPAGEVPILSEQGTETVLLAEDDVLVRDLIQEILTKQGYRVLASADCRQAAQIAQRHHGPIHILITDVVMPEVNGRELAAQIHAVRPETKVLYMSGYSDDAIVRHGVVDPGATLLEKPFTAQALARKVRAVLGAP